MKLEYKDKELDVVSMDFGDIIVYELSCQGKPFKYGGKTMKIELRKSFNPNIEGNFLSEITTNEEGEMIQIHYDNNGEVMSTKPFSVEDFLRVKIDDLVDDGYLNI
jgi:uncharacterized protein YuzE